MRRVSVWRAAAGAVILVAAFLAFRHFCIQPYRCALAMTSLQAASLRAAQGADTPRGIALAQRNLERLDALDPRCHEELEWIMLTAANRRVAGDARRAVDLYTRALVLYQRPEIYFNRGMTFFELHQVDRAVPDLATAATFNPTFLEELDAETQALIRKAMAARQ